MPSMNVRIANLAALFSKNIMIDSEPKILPSMNVRIANLVALFSKKLTIDSEPKIPSIQLKRSSILG